MTCIKHGSCNHRCKPEGATACQKNYPKDFCKVTTFSGDGYPKLKRPRNGPTFKGPVRNGVSYTYSNCDIVPYNPYLLCCYKCYINIEACVSVMAVKYIHKYIYKGHDCTTLELSSNQDRDKIKEYLDSRYVSACEACWRTFKFDMHKEEPNIY